MWLRGEYEDVNRAMIEEGARYIPNLIEDAQRRQQTSDIARKTFSPNTDFVQTSGIS
jgi:hypothetical protein